MNFTIGSDSDLTEIFSLFSSCFWFWNRYFKKQKNCVAFVVLCACYCVFRFRKCMTLENDVLLFMNGKKLSFDK